MKKEFNELNQLVVEHLTRYAKTDKQVFNILDKLYDRLKDISKGEEIESNAYILSIGAIQLKHSKYKNTANYAHRRARNNLVEAYKNLKDK